MSRHADAVLAATETGDATSMIQSSWRRCLRVHRIDPDAIRGPAPDGLALRRAQERDVALIATARPYLDRLYEALADRFGCVTLVDRNGLMIAMSAGRTHDVHESGLSHWIGSDVSEAVIGTNGNGTCLAEERPVVVSGSDHFLAGLTHTVCIAAPIFGPDGALLGCLNALTSAANPAGQHLEGPAQLATRDFALRIETELFAAAHPGMRIVMASQAGRNPAALLSVDRDGVVVGATRAACRLLDLEPGEVRGGIDLDTLRGTATSATIADAEPTLIARALASHRGNVSAAARSLGISRSTVYRKMVALLPHD